MRVAQLTLRNLGSEFSTPRAPVTYIINQTYYHNYGRKSHRQSDKTAIHMNNQIYICTQSHPIRLQYRSIHIQGRALYYTTLDFLRGKFFAGEGP